MRSFRFLLHPLFRSHNCPNRRKKQTDKRKRNNQTHTKEEDLLVFQKSNGAEKRWSKNIHRRSSFSFMYPLRRSPSRTLPPPPWSEPSVSTSGYVLRWYPLALLVLGLPLLLRPQALHRLRKQKRRQFRPGERRRKEHHGKRHVSFRSRGCGRADGRWEARAARECGGRTRTRTRTRKW